MTVIQHSGRLARLFYCLISALVVMALPLHAADPAKTIVSDTMYRADGSAARGTLLISWPAFSTADGKPVAAGTLSVKIGASGSVNIPLLPTQGATPAGTAYRVVVSLDDGSSSTEYWAVPALSPTTIAAIRSTQVPATVAMQVVSRDYVDSQLATAVRRSGDETIAGSKTFDSSPLVPPPGTDAAAANKGYVDVAIAAAAPSASNVLNINKGGTGTNSFAPARCVRVADDGNSLEAAVADCGNSNADTVDGVHAADLTSATKIQGTAVATTAPQAGQQLNFDGAQYAPQSKEHVDVRDVQIAPSTTGNLVDNSSRTAALMNAVSTSGWNGGIIRFPQIPGSQTFYYFSTGLHISRPATLIDCGTSGRSGGVNIVVPAGIDGMVTEEATTSSDGFQANYSTIRGCGVYSLGAGYASTTQGSSTVTGLGTYSQGPITAAPFATGDGIIIVKSYSVSWNKARQDWDNLTVPAGTWLSSVTGTSGTLVNGMAATPVTAALTGSNQMAIRLPAALACTATFTNGSQSVTNINCPFKLQPGSMIWSDAFPLKSWAAVVSGAQGNQTATVTVSGSTGTASYSGTGKFWVIPAGIHLLVSARLEDNYAYGFGAGIAGLCSSSGALNCTAMTHIGNMVERNLWGRYLSGNNSGGGQAVGTVFVHDFLNDSLDDGSIGNLYSGESYNSSESDSINAVQGNCANQNNSSYAGGYTSPGGVFCNRDGGAKPRFVQPVYAHPVDVWYTSGNETNVTNVRGPDGNTSPEFALYGANVNGVQSTPPSLTFMDGLGGRWWTFGSTHGNPGGIYVGQWTGNIASKALLFQRLADSESITSIQRAANVVTLTLSSALRGLWVGQMTTIGGVTGSTSLNGTCTITAINNTAITCSQNGVDVGPFTTDGTFYNTSFAADVFLNAFPHPVTGGGIAHINGGNSTTGKVQMNVDNGSGQAGTEFGDGQGHVVAKIDAAGTLTATKITGITDTGVVANLNAAMVGGKTAPQLADALSWKGAALDASISSPVAGTLIGMVPAGATSYSNVGGQGDRSASIAVSASASTLTGPLPSWVNGSNDTGLAFTAGTASGKWVQFDFGMPKAVTEAKYVSGFPAPQGTWKWQGSADALSWSDLGSSFTLDGDSSATFTMAQLSGNSTAYRYYRILGVSGNTSSGPWVYEMQFKIGDGPTWGAVRDGWVSAPASSNASCVAGTRAYDATYLYICVATNTWKRTALAGW